MLSEFVLNTTTEIHILKQECGIVNHMAKESIRSQIKHDIKQWETKRGVIINFYIMSAA